MKNSIEYLINEVSSILNDTHLNSMQYLLLADALKKAREIYKQEIIKAHIDGYDHIVVDFKKQQYAEQYYNETYNQNES